jgi:uncharacterized protein (DUF58 family)
MNIGIAYVDVPHLAHLELRTHGLSFEPRQPRRASIPGQHAAQRSRLDDCTTADEVRAVDADVSLGSARLPLRSQPRPAPGERSRSAFFVVDQRMSMFFGSKRAMKSVAAAEVAALGIWMVFRAGDRVGAVIFNDEEIVRIQPRRTQACLYRIFEALARHNQALSVRQPLVDSGARLNLAIEQLLGLAPADGLICIVSDFAGADAATHRLLAQLAAHNEVIAMLIFDPLARELASPGRVVVSQSELQMELDMYAAALGQPLSSCLPSHLKNVAEMLRQCAVPLMAITTAEDPAKQLARLLRRTARRRN